MSRIVARIVTFVILLLLGAVAPRASVAQDRLTVVTRDGGPIAGPALRHAIGFTTATGVPVDVVQRPFSALYAEVMLGFVTGGPTADVLIFPAAWLPDFAPYLAPVPPTLVDSALVRGIHPAFRDVLMRWQGAWKAVTLDGDLHMGAYRRDLFEDPVLRAAYLAQHREPLEPPQDWAQYARIATFFQARPEVRYGTLEASAQGGQRLWYLFSHAAALMADRGSLFFDPVTMRPSIDSPGWERALQGYLDAVATGPDVALASHDVRRRFAAGDAAMAIDWSDIGLYASDPALSHVGGRAGFFVLPGSEAVWDAQAQVWRAQAAYPVPFLAFGGWIAAVPAEARAPDHAWDYIRWIADPARADSDVRSGASGFNAYRMSQLNDPDGWRNIIGDATESYLGVLRESLSSPAVTPDLRIPGYPAYMAALDAHLGDVLAGRAGPAQALAAAAVEWEQITDRLGRGAQARNYREAMRLRPETP
ncbi:ABC transporter substrate-binding protein [Citreicella sp. 357]|nr:ABC transporter substrate-binding protein [Citreicella sp. 357]